MIEEHQQPLLQSLMALPSTIAMGSYALDLPYRDVDLAVHAFEIAPFNLGEPIKEYGNHSPLLIHGTLYQVGKIDIFVYEHSFYLEAIDRTMKSMKRWPKWLLRLKLIRIVVFRAYLKYNKFY